MSKTLFITGLISLIVWVIGYVAYQITGLIHVLLFIGVLTILIRIFNNKLLLKNQKPKINIYGNI
jgi:hypothetical protein